MPLNKMLTDDKTHIKHYLEALSNEIAIDEQGYMVLGKDINIEGYFPRPAKSLMYLEKVPLFIRRLMVFFWRYIISYLFFTVQFLQFLFKIRKHRSINNDYFQQEVAIAFSHKAMEIINEKNLKRPIDAWVTFNWLDSSPIEKNLPKVDLFNLISAKDLLLAVRLAFKAHATINNSPNLRNWTIQSYTAFKWFLTRIGLAKLKSNFVIAEHFDRWAVLVDGLNEDKVNAGEKFNYTLVQHGVVGDISDTAKLNLPYKLKWTTELLVYDENSEKQFKSNIFAVDHLDNLQKVSYFESQLELVDLPPNNETVVLIVGNPICEQFHRFVVIEIKKLFDLKIYYKPHPLTPCSSMIKDLDLILIEDKNFFPRVDVVITYPSTLAVEYGKHGITTLSHPIDVEPRNSGPFIEGLIAALKINNKV